MKLFVTALAALALGAGAASAHHSGVMFDHSKETVLDGTIKEFGWSSPHGWIRMMVPDATGALKEWVVEAGNPASLARQGWTKATLKPGDKVVLKIYPLKGGGLGGAFKQITLADGRVLGGPAGSSGPD